MLLIQSATVVHLTVFSAKSYTYPLPVIGPRDRLSCQDWLQGTVIMRFESGLGHKRTYAYISMICTYTHRVLKYAVVSG